MLKVLLNSNQPTFLTLHCDIVCCVWMFDVTFCVNLSGCRSENSNRSNYLLHCLSAWVGCKCSKSRCGTQGKYSVDFNMFFSAHYLLEENFYYFLIFVVIILWSISKSKGKFWYPIELKFRSRLQWNLAPLIIFERSTYTPYVVQIRPTWASGHMCKNIPCDFFVHKLFFFK